MTHFEFVAVMVSIILGLGIVRLLSSMDKIFSEHRYWPHAVWTITIFWIHVQNWWALWEMRTVAFNIAVYSILVSYASLVYLSTVALTNRVSSDTPWKEHYFARRQWFFGVLALMAFVGIFISRLFFGAPLWHPYRLVQVSLLAMAVIGAVSDREQVHKVITALFFVVMAAGVTIFRYLPDLFGRASEF